MEKELKILMLEDVAEDAQLIARNLRKGGMSFTMKRVDTRSEFIEAIETFKPDVVLSDHSMPQFNSIEALKIFRVNRALTPFILVTGAVSEEFAVSCLQEGADDYILKSNLTRLPSAIASALEKKKIELDNTVANASLRSQNEELKKLNQELDRFVYSTSHNLRAPLLSVLGLIYLCRKEFEEQNYDALPQYFEMEEKSVKQLDNTLKQIIEYSKNARLPEQFDEIDFKTVVENVFEYMKFMRGASAVMPSINIHEGPSFYCDKTRMGFLLQNLISNSIKYSDDSKKHPYVNVEVFKNEEGVTIVVEDNGIGISENHKSHVFDMFYRATDRSEGSGLGLYIVKETIDMMGGSIQMNSEKGKGTSVTLTIPNAKHEQHPLEVA